MERKNMKSENPFMKVMESLVYCSVYHSKKCVLCGELRGNAEQDTESPIRSYPHWKGSKELLPTLPKGGALWVNSPPSETACYF